MPPPLDVNQMWEDIADQPQDDKEEVGEEENAPPLPERWTEEVPWVSAAAMLAGVVGALLSSWPNDLILFSLSVAVSAAAYKTGNSDIAIRSGAAFRILTRPVFFFSCSRGASGRSPKKLSAVDSLTAELQGIKKKQFAFGKKEKAVS